MAQNPYIYIHNRMFSIKITGIDWGMAKLYKGSTVGVKFYIPFIDFTTQLAVLLLFLFLLGLNLKSLQPIFFSSVHVF
jgi:hypothetical protein